MRQSNNESYNRIIEYIKENPELDSERRRILVQYASQLLINNIENIEDESMEAILSSIKLLNTTLRNGESTSIVARRLEEEIKLFELIGEYYEFGIDNKDEIIFQLDKLYLDSDMGVRKNSSFSYSLINKKGKGQRT